MATSNKMIGPAILSVALLTVMAGAAISPAIANIGKAFPDASPGLIKLVLTMPSLMVIPFALISGKLCDRFGKKNVLLTHKSNKPNKPYTEPKEIYQGG